MKADSPIAEQRLKNTARLAHQSMWLLFLVAAGLMIVVRRSAEARTGSIWMLGCGLLAFMFSFVLRDAVRKLGHRNTENRIVRDVKTFLEREPGLPAPQPALAIVAKGRPERVADDVPAKPAGFVRVNGAAPYRTAVANPVVFDTIPVREPVAVRTEFVAVMQPVMTHC
jgi:hypothetical protein